MVENPCVDLISSFQEIDCFRLHPVSTNDSHSLIFKDEELNDALIIDLKIHAKYTSHTLCWYIVVYVSTFFSCDCKEYVFFFLIHFSDTHDFVHFFSANEKRSKTKRGKCELFEDFWSFWKFEKQISPLFWYFSKISKVAGIFFYRFAKMFYRSWPFFK